MKEQGTLEELVDLEIKNKRGFYRYIRVLPKHLKVFYYIKESEDAYSLVFYLANEAQDINSGHFDTDKTFGYIEGIIFKKYFPKIIIDKSSTNRSLSSSSSISSEEEEDEEGDATIQWLSTNINYKGKGLGTYLILLYANYLHDLGLKTIELDDDSDQTRQDNNIYKNVGFRYRVEDDNSPEMIGNIRHIIKHWNSILIRKYQKVWGETNFNL